MLFLSRFPSPFPIGNNFSVISQSFLLTQRTPGRPSLMEKVGDFFKRFFKACSQKCLFWKKPSVVKIQPQYACAKAALLQIHYNQPPKQEPEHFQEEDAFRYSFISQQDPSEEDGI